MMISENPADMLSDSEMMRYARQILLESWDIDAQVTLKQSHALIVGAGGLGCPVATILARAGIGRLTLIDHDRVDVSNLQRQSLFSDTDVGEFKAITAANSLRLHNPLVIIHAITDKLTDANAASLLVGTADALADFKAPKLIIDCTDNFSVRDLINRTAMRLDIPLLSTSAIGETGQIALYTKETGCYHCVFGDVTVGDDERNCANSGVLASTVAIIGSMAAQVALDFLGRDRNPIKAKLVTWQGRTMSLRQLGYTKDTDCTVCN